MVFERRFQDRLFFTPIYGFKLNLTENYLAELIQESHNLYAQKGVYQQYRSTRDAFQSSDDINQHPAFQELFAVILQSFSEFVCKDYQIAVNDAESLVVKKAWVNVNPTGGYNVIHNHPNGFYSGVYYLQASENAGEIVFLNPVPEQGLTIPHQLVQKNSIYTSDRYAYSPRQDLLLLFPSYLNHYVHPNQSHTERICVAFNIGI